MRSSSPRVPRRAFVAGALSVALAACKKGDDTATEASIGPLLAPSALAARVDDIKGGKVAVLYVGPDALFGRGHVPGARNVGAVDSEGGRRALSEELAAIPAETDIVLYCGCCPVRSCPNIRPASAALRKLGRANAHVLDLPTRFSTDWSDKGYPVERS
ncbi:MAG: rhodanese-like domain-containing protein [Myxococcales bacterium]|nr:rhodanese-like domain-containing protein [Myxococcales bacterium]